MIKEAILLFLMCQQPRVKKTFSNLGFILIKIDGIRKKIIHVVKSVLRFYILATVISFSRCVQGLNGFGKEAILLLQSN